MKSLIIANTAIIYTYNYIKYILTSTLTVALIFDEIKKEPLSYCICNMFSGERISWQSQPICGVLFDE